MGIVNRNGALWMATGVDNSGLYSGLNQAEGRIDQFGAHVGNVGNQIAKLTGIGFGVAGLKAFGSEIINVRGEMQMLESSFEVLLGGKGVSGFMSEMKQFAVDSPLSLTSVGDAAQMLLAFGVEADKVMPVVKQLGDVSMGNTGKFQSLALAFSQMTSAGKVLTNDLRQMATAGFNPLGEIARTTGRSIQQVTEQMDKGQITVDMIANAFATATSEGGKFYGMTQKQAEGIKGLQAQLEGGLQDAFNEIGESQEGLIAGGYKVAISLIENYETIGKALTALVATYGTYKAAMVMGTAIDKTVTVMRYEAELAELTKLLPLKAQEANADLKAAVSSGKLTEVKAQQLIALRAEIESRRESIQSKLAEEQANLKALFSKRAEAKEALGIARSKTIAAKEELANAIATAQAEVEASLQKKMGLESERQSRVALRIVKLQERKDTAIEQARALKEKAASAEIVASKNREIASIHSKIIAAREEEIQHGRNVAAYRAELIASKQSITNKKIETLSKKVNTLAEKENAAATAHNGLIKQTVRGKILIKKIATDAETASTQINTATQNANTVSTKALTAAKTRLITVAKNLWTTLAPSPYVLAAAAIVALGYGIYKLATALTDAEIAQNALNRALEEGKNKKEELKSKTSQLLSIINSETEVLQEQLIAYKELRDLYPKALENIDLMAFKTKNATEQQILLNEAIYEQSKAYRESQISQAESLLAKINNKETSTKEWGKAIEEARSILGIDGIFDHFTTLQGEVPSLLQKHIDDLKGAKKEIEEVVSVPADFIDKPKQIEEAQKEVAKLKQDLKDLNKGLKPKDLKDGEQFDFAKGIEDKAKELKDAENKLNLLLYGKSTSDLGKGESASEKARKQAQDIIDQNERLLLLEKRQGVERQRAEEDLQNKATQASIDAMQNGAEKKAKQRDLDNKLELQAIDRQKEDYVQAIIQAQRELFDIQEELAVKKGEKKEKGVFKADPTGVDTSFFDSIKNDTTVKQTKEQLESLLSVYKDYEARKKEINDNYDADLTNLESRYTEAQTEQEKAKIDAAIVELKKQWSKALSSLNLEEFQDSIDWSIVFGNLDKVSTEEMVKLRDKLKEYLSSVGDSLSPQDLKTVTDAFENLDEKIANVKPIQGVIDGYNEYRSAVDDVAKAKEKLAKLEKGTDAYVEATKELTDAEKKRRDSLVKMSQSINSIGQKGTALVNSMGELMGMFEKFGVEFPESIKEGLEGVGQMMSGLESLDLTKPMSVITSSVSIVSGLGSTIAGLFGSSDQLTQATIDSYNRYMSTVDKLIAKQKELLESVSGTDAVVLANQARESVQRQIDATQKIASDWLSSKSGGKYSGGNWRGADKVISNYRKELQALGHDISSAQYDLITLSPEELEKIRNDLPKMWADFDSDFSEWLNTIIDLGETMEEIAKKEKERLTGLSFDSLKNSFDDLLKSADTTFEDIGNSFEDHMRNAVLNFVKSKYLTDALKGWYNEFAKAYDDDELSKSEVEQLRKMYEEAYNKAQGLYDSALDVIGVDKEGGDSRSSQAKGFATASQDSIDRVEGLWTISVEHTRGILELSDNINEQLRLMNIDNKGILTACNSILNHTYNIEKNTQELYDMKEDIQAMRGDISNLVKHGITLKK